jgi:hypothetical protein
MGNRYLTAMFSKIFLHERQCKENLDSKIFVSHDIQLLAIFLLWMLLMFLEA